MCGILGHIGREAERPGAQEIQNVLQHRGPDNFGFSRVGNCSFWHYRLSILDTSELGNQPRQAPVVSIPWYLMVKYIITVSFVKTTPCHV